MGQFLTNPSVLPLGATRNANLTPTIPLKGEGYEVVDLLLMKIRGETEEGK